jgi:hypothetical protein
MAVEFLRKTDIFWDQLDFSKAEIDIIAWKYTCCCWSKNSLLLGFGLPQDFVKLKKLIVKAVNAYVNERAGCWSPFDIIAIHKEGKTLLLNILSMPSIILSMNFNVVFVTKCFLFIFALCFTQKNIELWKLFLQLSKITSKQSLSFKRPISGIINWLHCPEI